MRKSHLWRLDHQRRATDGPTIHHCVTTRMVTLDLTPLRIV